MPYNSNGPVDCNAAFDTSNLKGKTAVITGGANGIGEAYVRALTKAGAWVAFCDLDEAAGSKLESECSGKAIFVKCNVVNWGEQLAFFKKAIEASPNHRIDVVAVNAGITGADSVFNNDVNLEEPQEPNLNIFTINAMGALYTIKLALHYFRRQASIAEKNGEEIQETNLVMGGSMAGYADLPQSIEYAFSKFGLRGAMCGLRHTEEPYKTRVNYIAPWFIRTKILSAAYWDNLEQAGVPFATVEDAAQTLLHILSDTSINGRALAVVPRLMAPSGHVDINADDGTSDFLRMVQALALRRGDENLRENVG